MVTTPAGDSRCDGALQQLHVRSERMGRACLRSLPQQSFWRLKQIKINFFPHSINKAMEGDKDCGGIMACDYLFRGTGDRSGRGPSDVFAQTGQSFGTCKFYAGHIYIASLATLKIGLDILLKEEDVEIDSDSPDTADCLKRRASDRSILAAAMNAPISVMETAGEGGAWGMALLAAYMLFRRKTDESLGDYLDSRVFADSKVRDRMEPDTADVAGFEKYYEAVSGMPCGGKSCGTGVLKRCRCNAAK